jgi:hypothetical protein
MYNIIKRTELAQYGNSPIITALICQFNAWIDPTVNLRAFYTNLWNISTAQGAFLDVWGMILGVSRYLQISVTLQQFGFSGGPPTASPFNVAPFNSGANVTQTYALSDSDFRQLLFAKAFANICRTVIPVMNQLLMMVFGASGQCYVQDTGNMTMSWVFDFVPSNVQYAIIAQSSGVLPHPTGVLVSIVTPSDTDMLLEDGITLMLTEGGIPMLLE